MFKFGHLDCYKYEQYCKENQIVHPPYLAVYFEGGKDGEEVDPKGLPEPVIFRDLSSFNTIKEQINNIIEARKVFLDGAGSITKTKNLAIQENKDLVVYLVKPDGKIPPATLRLMLSVDSL